MGVMGRGLAAWTVLGALATPAWAQIPRGPEFQVNVFTTASQTAGGVAFDGAGNFVVSWTGGVQDGDSYGIFARGYEPSGTPVGAAEFRVNTFTLGSQLNPRVAVDGNGQRVFVWETDLQDGSDQAIVGHRFDAAGSPLGEFLVNAYTTGSQRSASVGSDASGNFVVVWRGHGQGDLAGVFGRRYDAAGAAQGTDFRVNSYTTGTQSLPRVAVAADGHFVVVWEGYGLQDGSGAGVFAQRYDASGAAVGLEFRVNTYTTNGQGRPDVAADAAGNFVVVWSTAGQFGPYGEIVGRRYDASGIALGGEFRINTYSTGSHSGVAVASDARGGFVVVWRGPGQGDADGIFGRRYESTGAVSTEFAVNNYTTGTQREAAVAVDAAGNFVVAWTSSDAFGYGVKARRFRSELIFEDDFESGGLSAWSSSATDGGDLAVSSSAALDFTVAGLRGLVDDTTGLFVQDDTPEDETRYRVRFHLDPNGFDPGELEDHRRTRVFIAFTEAPLRRVAALVLRRLGGVYAVMGRARLDDNSQADTGFFTITDGPHLLEFDLNLASDRDAHDGTFELRIDGVSRSVLTGLDNSLARVDLARMGALSVKTGANGTIYWDEFESWRTAFPGP